MKALTAAYQDFIGPRGYVAERLAAFREAGVTYLDIEPFGDPTPTIEALREIADV